MIRDVGPMAHRLPAGMQDDEILLRLLELLEVVASSGTERIGQLSHLADFATTPAPFLNWQGTFVSAPPLDALDEEDQRRLVRSMGSLLKFRGTKAYLAELIQPFAAGGYEIEDSGGVRPLGGFREESPPSVSVTIGQLKHVVQTDLFDILRLSVPAHCTLNVSVREPEE